MCRFKSGIIFKDRVVLAREENESHSMLLDSLNIEDNILNAMNKFVRAELVPNEGNKANPIERWEFIVDQDVVPRWFDKDRGRYEQEFRRAVEEYLTDRFLVMCEHAWTPIKTDARVTYVNDYGIVNHCSCYVYDFGIRPFFILEVSGYLNGDYMFDKDYIIPGRVVYTKDFFDIGLCTVAVCGKPIQIYARYDKRSEQLSHGKICGLYGAVDKCKWYNTGIRMTLREWKQLSIAMGDALGFYMYWKDRLGF